ncbi:MAG: transposase [Saprospiraceae bacterium]
MYFEKEKIYHIYNRGNNHQRIFFKHENYLYFLRKVRKHISPVADVLGYCLMPNHFHFMIYANDKTIESKIVNKQERNLLSEALRNVLSSYTHGINRQENRSGSLFSQNTKAKAVFDSFHNFYYVETCFYYIHQNPTKDHLVERLEDWPYSSFLDFAKLRNGTLCNQDLVKKLVHADWDDFYNSMHNYQFNQSDLSKIF